MGRYTDVGKCVCTYVNACGFPSFFSYKSPRSFFKRFYYPRGVGRGQWGEGITGTTIKDTWTKSRRRVEVGEGGGFGWGGVEDGEKRQTTVIE